ASFVNTSSNTASDGIFVSSCAPAVTLRAMPTYPVSRPLRSRMRVMLRYDTHSLPLRCRLTTCPDHEPVSLRLAHISSYTFSGVLPAAMKLGVLPSHSLIV